MNRYERAINRVQGFLSYRKLKLRKWTTPIHMIFGAGCGYIIANYGWPAGVVIGIVFLVLFAVFEVWNDWSLKQQCPDYKPQGDMDWWESFLFCCIVIIVYVILDGIGIVNLNW